MVDFLFVAIYETFVKHETKISDWLEPLIYIHNTSRFYRFFHNNNQLYFIDENKFSVLDL